MRCDWLPRLNVESPHSYGGRELLLSRRSHESAILIGIAFQWTFRLFETLPLAEAGHVTDAIGG